MESMKEDWHPVFKFLLELFDCPGYKAFYNRKKSLVVEITSRIEDYEVSVCLSKRMSLKSIVYPPKIRQEKEKYIFDFSDGSLVIEKSGWFESFLEERMYKKYSYGPLHPRVSMEGITNRMLDKLIDLIIKSDRMDSISGRIISKKEAEERDEKVREKIFGEMKIAKS